MREAGASTMAVDAARSAQLWDVPEFYNMAVDVADRHERSKTALLVDSAVEGRFAVSWGEVQDRSRQVANALSARGVRPGDRVAVLLPQRSDTLAVYLGVLRTGAILVTVSLLWAPEPIAYRLGDSEASVIIAEPADQELLCEYADKFLAVDSPEITSASTTFEDAPTRAEDPALIFYTSGTTGAAKGIVHAHRTLLGHNEFVHCHGLHDGDIFYGAGDWAWSMAKLLGPLRLGAQQLVFRPRAGFDPHALFASLERHRVSHALLNPTLVRKLMSSVPDAGARYQVPLETVCSSNEPLTADLISWFQDQFGVTLLDYYGSTESYPLLGNFPGTTVKPGSMGQALPGWQVSLLDEQGNPVALGEPGEICLRAHSNPQYPLGYWKRPELSTQTFGGTWYRTKDQAYQDEDGYYWFLGRTDDVIKTSGYRVGPYELEAKIRELPEVQDVSVTGVPDPVRGQVIKAWIELAPGQEAGTSLEAKIIAHVKATYSAFAYPRLFEYVDQLPRSATGKVQRTLLRLKPQSTSGLPSEPHPEREAGAS